MPDGCQRGRTRNQHKHPGGPDAMPPKHSICLTKHGYSFSETAILGTQKMSLGARCWCFLAFCLTCAAIFNRHSEMSFWSFFMLSSAGASCFCLTALFLFTRKMLGLHDLQITGDFGGIWTSREDTRPLYSENKRKRMRHQHAV